MIGPSLKTQGGISSVLSIYKNQLSAELKLEFIPSYSGHGRIYDLYYFCTALIRVLLICLTGEKAVFHIHMSTGGSYIRKSIIARLCKLFGKNVVLHIHGADFDEYLEEAGRFSKKDIIALLNKMDVIVVLSESWKKYFEQYISPDKIKVIYNPCAAIAEEYRSRQNPAAVVLFIGRMGRRKGTYDLIEAAARLRHLDFNLQLYGDGDVDLIRKLVLEQGLQDKVGVNGWISHDAVFSLYAKADLLVLPSYAEGMPMSVLEAIGAGLPVISTFAGGTPEIIADGVNGFLIKPGDIDALADRLKSLIEDTGMRERMGRAALETAKSKFSVETAGHQLAAIYLKFNPSV